MTSITRAIENSLKPLGARVLLAWERLESGVAYHPGSDKVLADSLRPVRTIAPQRPNPPHETD